MNAEITFFEKSVTYDKFVTDIAARLASFMKEDKDDPEYLTAESGKNIRTGKHTPLEKIRSYQTNNKTG